MTRCKLLFLTAFLLPLGLLAQGEGGYWFLGSFNYMNLNTSPIQQGNTPTAGFYASVAVCHPNGNLRFYVKAGPDPVPMIFGASGTAIANSELFSDHSQGGSHNVGMPVVIPKPGNADQYYIFHSLSRGLLYTLLDMSLNNGQGGIVQKNVQISGFGTVVPGRMVAVKGCGGIWLVIRSFIDDKYLSYLVTSSGVGPTPVTSEVGLFTHLFGPTEYANGTNASLKSSPDGTKIATYSLHSFGLELYDFEKCSGKLSNPRLIDTLDNPRASDTGYRQAYTGMAFSENSRFLYVAKHRRYTTDSVSPTTGIYLGQMGVIDQYDLNGNSTNLIISSRTRVMTNPYILLYDFFWGCGVHLSPEFKDIKRGPDGRIYVHNNVPRATCSPGYSPTYSNDLAWHVIAQPNNPGLACQPQYNLLASPVNSSFIHHTLAPDLVKAPDAIDTIVGNSSLSIVCFKDSVLLNAPYYAQCRNWFDGKSDKQKAVGVSGKYSLGYYSSDCSYRIDTYQVYFVKMPKLTDSSYSCPGTFKGKAILSNTLGDTTAFSYQWMDRNGLIIHNSRSSVGDTVKVLDTGLNYVRITTATGCDTVLSVYVRPLPKPTASFSHDTIICRGQPITFNSTSASPVAIWFFGNSQPGLNSQQANYTFDRPGPHQVVLVARNIEGCSDTAARLLNIKDFELNLNASPNTVNIGEEIALTTAGSTSYHVLSWQPGYLFSDQHVIEQRTNISSATSFGVIGRSVDGCLDTAWTNVVVNPVVFIPNAFTPNGDGKNDVFRVATAGAAVRVKVMNIYNRWGQRIFAGYNGTALAGWDGNFNAKPCEAGTYFYTIAIETEAGSVQHYKGDVALIR